MPQKQHPMLVDRRHREEAEDHRDHEDVVDAQRLLDDVPGQVLDRRRHAVVDHPVDRIGRTSQSQPVVLVPVVDKDGEGQPHRDPHGGPREGLLHRDHMGFPMEDPQVQRQHQQHQKDESSPYPDHSLRSLLVKPATVRAHGCDGPRSASISRRSARSSSRTSRVCSSPSSLRSAVTCDCIALTTTAMNKFSTMNVAMSR